MNVGAATPIIDPEAPEEEEEAEEDEAEHNQ